ncbi:MAG TPA: hypothetical protein VM100_08405 [Longimicrobiales bacterium]|nr:hypothetical protein [Longimicrobiales bacterium]
MAQTQHAHEPNKIALAIGFGIGITWIAMALWCLYNAIFQGYGNDRTDYGFLWSVVGVLLFGCGVAALVGTWWHQFRVMAQKH